ncbi:MAG: hypothetical protein QKC69_gp1 [Anelloviridae sp.]|uniref:Uncharacterized protein n=1 Tax=Anelloviridae sp. TaxID=2055263 RepID=A0A3G2YTC1_9VIRU|nr:MAG: hypothetical protein QKC69_gp1 [Anelloviridae sp.]AYP28923.1 MAG: hypothetical protein [Anelloviridae sp.]
MQIRGEGKPLPPDPPSLIRHTSSRLFNSQWTASTCHIFIGWFSILHLHGCNQLHPVSEHISNCTGEWLSLCCQRGNQAEL